MIIKLKNSKQDVANQVYRVFQNAYRVEAQLICASDFPPLSRSVNDIKKSATHFYGYVAQDILAGVIELSQQGKCIEIDSLTVDPDYFKKGIAGKLVSHVIEGFEFTEAVVETAVANEPAVNLYKKHGFVEFKRWVPSHGIEKLAMMFKKP